MATSHHFEYSKSSRAACHGPLPCKGTPIELGVLRYGKKTWTQYGEKVEWSHWGCVIPAILDRLKTVHLERVPGFNSLRREDQLRIRTAVANRHIDPADIPPSAKAIDITEIQSTASSIQTGGKRKADSLAASSPSQPPSQPSILQLTSSQPSASQRYAPAPSQSDIIEIDDDEDINNAPEDDTKDELYCMLKTNIVGIQYYKGLVGAGEEVRLQRERQNPHDRNAVQVMNIAGQQLGHLSRNVAAKLAPLLDRHVVNVEAVMHEGNLNGFQYALSCTLKFFGASNKRDQLEPLLIWATPGQRGFIQPSTFASTGGINVTHTIPGATASSRANSSYTTGYPSSSKHTPSSRYPSASQGVQRKGTTSAQAAAEQAAAHAKVEALQKAAELRQMISGLEKVNDDGRRSSLLDSLCSVDDILTLPEHKNPPGINSGELKVNLLKHQSQALQWCLEREYPSLPKQETDKPVQFWLRKNGQKPYYYNSKLLQCHIAAMQTDFPPCLVATRTPQEMPPALGRGALCADSMGLGKTLTMIALILATKLDTPIDFSRSSLIVVPLSVLSNWDSQIEEHCEHGALTHCIYYGATTRSLTPHDLKKYDVVVTTYNVVVSEFSQIAKNEGAEPSKKRARTAKSKGLFDVHWKRVILDEGHNIRNPKTKMAKAVCELTAQRRWVLSGTPIINSPKDLGSILAFLRICAPLDKEEFFKRLILRPLKDGDPSGAELLRATMGQICIRRTKEMHYKDGTALVPLPPVEMVQIPVTLSAEARALYDDIEQLARSRFEGFMAEHKGFTMSVQSNVLSMLTRLRQVVLHPGLVPADYLEQLRRAYEDDAASVGAPMKITPENKVRLQGLLAQAIEDSEECPICMSGLNEPRITACAHYYCLPCITEVISRDPKCPMDRRPIHMADLVEPAPPTDLTQAPVPFGEDHEDHGESVGIRLGSSDKIAQLVHLLKLTPSGEKSLVFSQFTSFMDKIGEVLEAEGIPYVRFDGQMSAKRRQETLQRFSMPIRDEGVTSTSTTLSQSTSGRTTRARKSVRCGKATFNDDTFDSVAGSDHSDFAPSGGEDGCDSFVDDDDDDDAPMRKSKMAKRKAGAKGKGKTRFAARASIKEIEDLDIGVNPKVMMISLKAGALGLNLTVANNVYLMDPWWQEGIESQAIDRCNRIGQKKPVHVYQLIAENTVESKVIEIQERKKLLIKEAFSGIKSNETQRQKKEARLQDLIELFGIRQQAVDQDRKAFSP